jgi:ComF family protein
MYVQEFVSLIFPAYCASCSQTLFAYEIGLCMRCQGNLPRTHLHDQEDNKIERLFWGHSPIYTASAFLKMSRKSRVHNMIHQLKYNGNQIIGERLGYLFGLDLQQSQRMNHFDFIIPVPLHPKKKNIRGYNQCDCIAEGIAEAMKTKTLKENLVRNIYNESQTRKSRYARWENVDEIFILKNPDLLKKKHILLVDDVITTGSTLQACAATLSKVEGIKVSIGALAVAVHN